MCDGFRDVNGHEELAALQAEGCNVISGYLTILGTEFDPPLTELGDLSSLQRVGEHLSIFYHEQLVDLSGLEQLSRVDDYVYISGNRSLESLQGLNGLVTVSNDFSVSNNQNLTSLEGLDALRSIGSFLEVGYNYALRDLRGLEQLRELGGNLSIENSGVTSLAPLHDWPADVVRGELRIHDNYALPMCEVEKLDAHLDADYPSQGEFQCVENNATTGCP